MVGRKSGRDAVVNYTKISYHALERSMWAAEAYDMSDGVGSAEGA
jgi:hypothetical protein